MLSKLCKKKLSYYIRGKAICVQCLHNINFLIILRKLSRFKVNITQKK